MLFANAADEFVLFFLEQILRKRTTKLVGAEVDQYLRYFMFTIETAVKNMRHGAEQWVFVIDMNSKWGVLPLKQVLLNWSLENYAELAMGHYQQCAFTRKVT
jgi:hypothetical protein